MITIFSLIILVISAVIHEVSHGFAANALGDPTARYAGRLSLNPLKHLDPFGSVILPLLLIIIRSPFFFAAAKPVPVNPNNFKNQKRDMALVGLAGPLSNFIIAFVFSIILRFIPADSLFNNYNLGPFIGLIIFVNILLGVFNLIPVPPLDGSRLLIPILPRSMQKYYHAIEQQPFLGIFISLVIAFFIVFPYIIYPLINFALGNLVLSF